MPKWTFLTNHALVLSFLARHPRITAVELAQAIGIRERAIRKIIADLQADGYIRKKREGRGNTYTINLDLPLRSETHQHVAIGNLLETLDWGENCGEPPACKTWSPKAQGTEVARWAPGKLA